MSSRGQGERAGLSRDLVLDAAVALVDRDGLDHLSMRKLGAALGVEAMTLYHYLPNKAALLDGLVEWVLEHATTGPATDGLRWDETLRRYAETLRTALLGHPGVLPLFFTRPAVTPQTLRAVERGLRVLSDAGLRPCPGRRHDQCPQHFRGRPRHGRGRDGRPRRPGGPGSAAALAGLDDSDLPLVSEAARLSQGVDDEARFQFALDALLCGFARRPERDGKPKTPKHHRGKSK